MREQDILDKFVRDQLSVWPLAAANFRALKDAQTRELPVGGLTVRIQHNPARIRSSAAKVDKASIEARSCFLCADARPKEQRTLKFEGRKGRKYDILVNPYPIFPGHLTIARDRHVDQSIWKCLTDMADLAHHYTGLTVFYNGPRCGASAPDHMHFQACPRGMLPLENAVDRQLDTHGEDLAFLTSVKRSFSITSNLRGASLCCAPVLRNPWPNCFTGCWTAYRPRRGRRSPCSTC